MSGNAGYVCTVKIGTAQYQIKNEWIKQGSFSIKEDPRIASQWTDEAGTRHTNYIGSKRVIKVTFLQYEKGVDADRIATVKALTEARRVTINFESRKNANDSGTFELKSVTEKQAYSGSEFVFFAETTFEWEEV